MTISQMQNIYTQNGARIAIDCYNHTKEYPPDTVIHSLTFLLRFNTECSRSYRNCPSIYNILIRVSEVFEYVYSQKSNGWEKYMGNLADIYQTYGMQPDLIDRLRTLIDIPPIRGNDGPINKREFHDDNQNVHNSMFNKSVLRASIRLVSMYPLENTLKPVSRGNERKAVIGDNKGKPDYREIETILLMKISPNVIDKVLTRIKTDPSTFNIGYTLEQVLGSVWEFITSQPSIKVRSQLVRRLSEEFTEMKSLCATGHLARLINVIQGFTNDPELQVSITESVNYKMILKSHMEAILRDAPDEVIDGMIDKTEEYEEYVVTEINKKLEEWIRVYGQEITSHIEDLVCGYCGLSTDSVKKIKLS